MGNYCARRNSSNFSHTNNELTPESTASLDEELQKKNPLDSNPAPCDFDLSNKQLEKNTQQKLTPSKKEPPEKMEDDNDCSAGVDKLLTSIPYQAKRATTEPIIRCSLNGNKESNENIRNLDRDNESNGYEYKEDSNDTENLDDSKDESGDRRSSPGVNGLRLGLELSENIEPACYMGILDYDEAKQLGSPIRFPLLQCIQESEEIMHDGALPNPPSLEFDGMKNPPNDPNNDGGGYLFTFDREIRSILAKEFPANDEALQDSPHKLVSDFTAEGIDNLALDFSCDSEPETGPAFGISLVEDIEDRGEDRFAHLHVRFVDTPDANKSFKRADSAVAKIDFRKVGPPQDLPKMNSRTYLHNSQLRTEPRFQPHLSIPSSGLSNEGDSDSETGEDGFIQCEGRTLVPITNHVPVTVSPSTVHVEKPNEIRRVSLLAPFFQDKHYREALTEFGNDSEENLLTTRIIDSILEHVIVAQEEWEKMFGVYSETIGMHEDWIFAVDYDPVMGNVVSGGRDDRVQIWDSTKEAMGHASLPVAKLQTTDTVRSVLFLDPETVVIGTQSEMKIWEWQKELSGCSSYYDRLAIMCLTRIPGQPGMFVSGQENAQLSIWDVHRDKPVATYQDHTKEITTVTTISNGRVIISGSRDCTIRFWDRRVGIIKKNTFNSRSPNKHPPWINGVCSLSDSVIATAHSDNTIKIWDRRKHDLTACIATLKGHTNYVWDVKRVADSGLLSASADFSLKMWDWKRGCFIQDLTGSGNGVFSMATDHELKLFSVGMDDHVRSWNLWI